MVAILRGGLGQTLSKRKKMYFVPAVLALMVYMIYPSFVLAGTVGAAAWVYLMFGGPKSNDRVRSRVRVEVAYRILSVKALAISGDYDDLTYDVHQTSTPDEFQNTILRSRLRDASGATSEGWQKFAKTIKRHSRPLLKADRNLLINLYKMIIVQITSQPSSRIEGSRSFLLSREKEDFARNLAKIWGIRPDTVNAIFSEQRVVLS